MNWLDLRKEVQDATMSYFDFEFPIEFVEDKNIWRDAKGHIFYFSKPGYLYLVYRLETLISDKKAFKALFESDPKSWTNKVNRLTRTLKETNTSGKGWSVSGKPLVAAHRGLPIYGLMTKYNDVSNLSVCDLVEKWGMVDKVTDYSLSNTEFILFLACDDVQDYEWGMAIRNGETGHATFSYRIYFKSDDYTFTREFANKTNTTRRHMSRIDEVENNLQAVFEEISELGVWQTIEQAPAKNYAGYLKLKKEYAKLVDVFEMFEDESTLDKLLFKLAKMKKEKGYKTVCNKATDEIFNLVKFMKED